MAIRSTKSSNNEEKQKLTIRVKRAKDFTKEGGKTVIGFDVNINGIDIYGCWYRIATNKKGEDFAAISFPSHKGEDGKYYNYAYVKLEPSDIENLEKQIESSL